MGQGWLAGLGTCRARKKHLQPWGRAIGIGVSALPGVLGVQEVSRKSCRVKEAMLFPKKVSVFVEKCVYSPYFQGSLYFPP